MNTDYSSLQKKHQRVIELAKGIYQIKIPLGEEEFSPGDLNSYLIEGTQGYLMIDTCWDMPLSWAALEEAFRILNIKYTDIRTIVLTHSHPDHYGMVGLIKQKAPKIELLCHRWEADLIEARYINFSEPRLDVAFLLEKHGVPEHEVQSLGAASMPILPRVAISHADRVLYGGEIIRTGVFDLEVIWTPGHSPGHICLYEPKNKFLFCGDHILPTITSNIGYHVFSGDNPLGDYYHALSKLFRLEVELVNPGHEYSFPDLQNRIKSLFEHHLEREAEILNLIENNYSNSFQIASRLTWSLNLPWSQFAPIQKRFAVTETIAHLEYMRWEGKVTKTFKNNQIRYDPMLVKDTWIPPRF
jgi:glyoxylase-like metal-dependent hydrolase (beta-lactamase superfamily II)